MGVHIINSYAGAPASTPLGLSLTLNADPVLIPVPPGQTGATSNVGDVNVSSTASGGQTPYSYSWSLAEISDPGNHLSVASQGTTTNANYTDATISTNANNPATPPPPPPPDPGVYRATCTVTDGNSDQVTQTVDINVEVQLL